ncbi:hypothetical protein CNO08_24095 [Lysobacter capsici]|nr:hypothetical protein CNO08_24095 [Lysobacter capsici]
MQKKSTFFSSTDTAVQEVLHSGSLFVETQTAFPSLITFVMSSMHAGSLACAEWHSIKDVANVASVSLFIV